MAASSRDVEEGLVGALKRDDGRDVAVVILEQWWSEEFSHGADACIQHAVYDRNLVESSASYYIHTL